MTRSTDILNLFEATSEEKKILVEYAVEILKKIKKDYPDATPIQLEHSLNMIFRSMTPDRNHPGIDKIKKYIPVKYDETLFEFNHGAWHRMKDAHQKTIFNRAFKKLEK